MSYAFKYLHCRYKNSTQYDNTTQNSTEAFITSGKQDPYFSQEALDTMMLGMKSAQINPNSYMSIYGHQLVQEEIDAIKSWYNKVDEK